MHLLFDIAISLLEIHSKVHWGKCRKSLCNAVNCNKPLLDDIPCHSTIVTIIFYNEPQQKSQWLIKALIYSLFLFFSSLLLFSERHLWPWLQIIGEYKSVAYAVIYLGPVGYMEQMKKRTSPNTNFSQDSACIRSPNILFAKVNYLAKARVWSVYITCHESRMCI